MSFHRIILMKLSILCCCFLFHSNQAQAQLYINELMASNSTGITDESGDYDDWVEIYNAGSSDIDLAGYYMSDDLTMPTLWQIPSTNPSLTTVPAGGFLILWADKDLADGANHLNFKLGSGGESVSLYLPDGSTSVDEVTFGAQNTDVSYGRAEDGSPSFQTFPVATPGVSNTETVDSTYPAILVYQINSNSDDAEQFTTGQMKLTSSDIEMIQDGPNQQVVGLRFTGIDVEQGTTITNAYLQFNSYQATGGLSNLTIAGVDNINPSTFTETDFDITNRALTTSTVAWSPNEWLITGSSGDDQKSTDIASIIQELVDKPSWTDGNAMAFVINGTGTRTAYAHDTNPILSSKLIIQVQLPAPTEPVVDLYINEVAARGTDYADESGDYEDWIELFNGSTETINVGGLFLTDDENNLTKWQIGTSQEIAPNDHLIIWTDSDPEEGPLHTNFKLSGGGGTLALVQVLNNSASIIDSVQFGDIPFKATYGRQTDGNSSWVTFGEITPDETNNGAGLWLSPPSFSLDNGAYTGNQSLVLSHPQSGVQIYYTTDGSDPSTSSSFYNNPITINDNMAVRAIAKKTGYAESRPGLRSYLIDNPLHLPTLFLTSDPDNFFSDESGIYVVGTNGIPGYCDNDPRNWAQDTWERPANLTLFEKDGSTAFNVDVGVKIGGACSRNFALKALNIYLREKEYGDDNIDYQLYKGRDHNNYNRFKLRNSGQDFVRMGFRDGLIHTILWDKVDLDLQGFLPTTMYLNGEYWGIHNIRENFTDEYFENNYGIDKDELDLIKSPGLGWQEVKNGDDENYMALYNYIENNDLSVTDNYNYVADNIDVNEFLNYWIAMSYTGNYDWPANNVIVWRERKSNAKWRWAVLDTDGSTANGLGNQADFDFNTLAQIMDPNSTTWPNHSNSTVFLRGLLENTQFRDEFIQRNCSFMELVYQADRVNMMTDSIQNMLSPEIDAHIAKWGADNAMGGDVWSWMTWVDDFREFFVERPDYFRGFIDDHFELNGAYELSVIYDADTGGDVFVNTNSMAIPFDYVGTYFRGVPLRVSAVAKPGFVFSHWLETGETTPIINFISWNNTTLTPIFTEDYVLSINLGADQSICEGASVTLDGTVAGCSDCTYEWEDGSTNPVRNITPLSTGSYTITVTNSSNQTADDVITITVNSLPTTSTSIDHISCEGAGDGMIDLTVNTGTAPFQYNWSNQSSSQDLDNLNPGNYSVTVTDSNECTTTDSGSITEPPALLFGQVDPVTHLTCYESNDGAIDILVAEGTPPYTFNWSNGSTNEDLTNLPAGSYTLTITEANDCETVLDFEVEEPTEIDYSATTSDIDCFGENDGSIDLNVNGGTEPYTYLWSNGANTADISNLTGGTYLVTITDNQQCSYISSYEIEAPDAALTATADASTLDCFDDNDASIELIVNGGTTPYSFSWNNGATTQNLNNLSGGTYDVTITDTNGCEWIESNIIINTPTALLTNITASSIDCYGAQDGSIMTNASGGSGDYSYIWNTGAISANLFNLESGTYTLTMTDDSGCEVVESVQINTPPPIEVTFATAPISCNGYTNGFIDLGVSGGAGSYNFLWNTGATTQDLYNLSAGFYEVTVTDVNNCEHYEAFTITQPEPLEGNATVVAVSCDGVNNGAIQTNPIGGTEPYAYEWSNGASAQNLSNLTTGTYYLTISDANNCQEVEVYTVDEVDGLFVDFTVQSISCFGANDGGLVANVSGGTGVYDYQWDTGNTTSSLSDLGPGIYQLTVVDNGNCEAVQSVEIIEPDPLNIGAGTIMASCGMDNGSVTTFAFGGIFPYSFEWNTGVATHMISDLAAGNYTITVTDQNNCSLSATYTITATPEITVSSTEQNTTCFGFADGELNLFPDGGNGSYQFNWSNGATTQNISDLTAGIYTVSVSDSDGCEAVYTAEITEPSLLTNTVNVQNVLCNGSTNGAIELFPDGGTSPYSYAWSNGASTQDISNLAAGVYEVSITDANSCLTLESIEVSEPDAIELEATITSPSSLGDDGMIEMMVTGGTEPYNYSWNNGATTSTISDLIPGEYTVQVTDANDCAHVATYVIEITALGHIEGISSLVLYPNPSDGRFTIDIESAVYIDGQLMVYDVLGRVFLKQAVQGQSMQVPVDLVTLSEGVYFVQLKAGEEVMTRKVLITK